MSGMLDCTGELDKGAERLSDRDGDGGTEGGTGLLASTPLEENLTATPTSWKSRRLLWEILGSYTWNQPMQPVRGTLGVSVAGKASDRHSPPEGDTWWFVEL